MRELWIWMGDRLAGRLDGTDRRSPRITYDQRWIDDPRATPLSTSMPLAATTHAGARVAAWLWGLLPDNERVIERWASRYQCSATDIVGLLAGVGSDVAGAMQFLSPEESPEESQSGQHRVVTESEVAEMLRRLRADGTAWHQEMGGRWSLAGAQAKLALAFDDDAGEWSAPSGSAPTTHILKPAITGLDHHDLNEHLCLKAAGLLGLLTARSRVMHFEGEPALVVTRYDRTTVDGRPIRIHQEDFCQALGVAPTNKYQADGGPSLEDMAAVLESVGLLDPRAAVRRLVLAVAFNWLILGTDAHAKNYSLLLSGPQVRLAPFYDLASAAVLDDHPSKLRMAQKIGGEYRPTVIARRHWERLGATTGVGGDQLCDYVARMANDLPDAFATAVAGEELRGGQSDHAARLLDGIAAWNRECQRALTDRGDRTDT